MPRHRWRGSLGTGLLGLAMGGAAAILAGCDDSPAPSMSEHSEFVGIWEKGVYGKDAEYVFLQIGADGSLSYARASRDEGVSDCVAVEGAQVAAVSDTEIAASVLWLFSMEFEINQAPTTVGDAARMTVDGRVFTRTGSGNGGIAYTWECDDGLIRRRAY